MSNLIPTPRTDKNGRTVVRHMKANGPTSVSTKLSSLPPLGSESSNAGLTDEEFGALIDPEGIIPKKLYPYFEVLRKDNPATLPFISELLTTGNENGRKLAMRKFSSMLDEVAKSYLANPAQWTRVKSRKIGIESEVAKNWAIGNVAEELGIKMDIDNLRDYHNLYGPASNTHYIQNNGAPTREASTIAYWRGTIAFNQTTIGWRESDKKEIRAFISWAGEQENLQAVVEVASERNTLDIDTLTGVLAERDSSSPVRNGVL